METESLEHVKALCELADLDVNDVSYLIAYPGNIFHFRVYKRSAKGDIPIHECDVSTCGGAWPFYCPNHGEPESEIIEKLLL